MRASPKWLFAKAALFVLVAVLAAAIVLIHDPHFVTAALLLVGMWAAARAYSFAFYVMEKYIDPSFRYSGLGSMLKSLLRRLQ